MQSEDGGLNRTWITFLLALLLLCAVAWQLFIDARPWIELLAFFVAPKLSWELAKSRATFWKPLFLFFYSLFLIVVPWLEASEKFRDWPREYAVAAVALASGFLAAFGFARGSVHAIGRLAAGAVGSLTVLVMIKLLVKLLPIADQLAMYLFPGTVTVVVVSTWVLWALDPLGHLGRYLAGWHRKQTLSELKSKMADSLRKRPSRKGTVQQRSDFETAVQRFEWLPASLTVVAGFVVEVVLSALGNTSSTVELVPVLLPFGVGAVASLLYLQHAGAHARRLLNVVSWRGYGEYPVLAGLDLDTMCHVLEYTGEIEGVASLQISSYPFTFFIADIERLAGPGKLDELTLPPASVYAAEILQGCLTQGGSLDASGLRLEHKKVIPLRWGIQDFVVGKAGLVGGSLCSQLKQALRLDEKPGRGYSLVRPFPPDQLATLPGVVVLWDFALATMQQALLAYLVNGKTTKDAVFAWNQYETCKSSNWIDTFGNTTLLEIAGVFETLIKDRGPDRVLLSGNPVEIRRRVKLDASCVFGAGSWIFGNWYEDPPIGELGYRYLPTQHSNAIAEDRATSPTLEILVWVEALARIKDRPASPDREGQLIERLLSPDGQILLGCCEAYAALPAALWLGDDFASSLEHLCNSTSLTSQVADVETWKARHPQWKVVEAMVGPAPDVRVIPRGGNAKFTEACEAAWARVREAGKESL